MKKRYYFILAIVSLILVVFFARLILPSQLDDVTPGIYCEENLLQDSDIYYVVPLFENHSIADDEKWCEEILLKNKTLALHGVYHTYEEFATTRNESYLADGVSAFEKCFNQTPQKFKPPQIAWTNENNWIKQKFDVDLQFNQLSHKTYHCSNTGVFPNWFVRIF